MNDKEWDEYIKKGMLKSRIEKEDIVVEEEGE